MVERSLTNGSASASPSKDNNYKNRLAQNNNVITSSSIVCKKVVIAVCFLVAISIILLHNPPSVDVLVKNNVENDRSKAILSHTTNAATQQTNKNPIRLIAILGERNSGTRWTFDHLTQCYNDTIEVRKGLSRYKHWFQYDNETKYPHDALVLAQFRNPYDWLKAMEHVPHHAPAHLRTKVGANVNDHSANNDWKIFLTKQWTMERYGADLELTGNEICQEDFLYRDIVSCVEDPLPEDYYKYTLRYSENQPFYEMRDDGSGIPYNNILELRTDKIRNFLNTIHYNGVADVWSLQYEYLVSLGTKHLLDRITELTGVEANCEPIPPQIRKPKGSRMIRADFAKHIRDNINWTVESWIGYYPELKYEQAPSQWRRYLESMLQLDDKDTSPYDAFESYDDDDEEGDEEYDYYEE